MLRNQLLLQIYKRLADLEEFRTVSIDYPETVRMIDTEMRALRLKLQDVMNTNCPLLKEQV
jgi:uncharacterized protein YaaN involved in tellurite resistance